MYPVMDVKFSGRVRQAHNFVKRGPTKCKQGHFYCETTYPDFLSGLVLHSFKSVLHTKVTDCCATGGPLLISMSSRRLHPNLLNISYLFDLNEQTPVIFRSLVVISKTHPEKENTNTSTHHCSKENQCTGISVRKCEGDVNILSTQC